jgi:hypothetical protein
MTLQSYEETLKAQKAAALAAHETQVKELHDNAMRSYMESIQAVAAQAAFDRLHQQAMATFFSHESIPQEEKALAAERLRKCVACPLLTVYKFKTQTLQQNAATVQRPLVNEPLQVYQGTDANKYNQEVLQNIVCGHCGCGLTHKLRNKDVHCPEPLSKW